MSLPRYQQEVQDIRAMRSGDADRVRQVLQRRTPLLPSLVPAAIRLLEWDAVADDAVRALRRVAERRVGELIDALTDPQTSFEVRRRLARVFSVCSSQRAADGLLLELEFEHDKPFEV